MEDSTSSRLDQIRLILESEFACDLTDVTLVPSLSLGHNGLGLDSLMIVDLLARLESEYSVEVDSSLLARVESVTVMDLLRLTSEAPRG